MAARTPRRSFATPFVITLAAVPACYVTSSPPPAQPQAAPQNDSAPGAVVANPPRPQPAAQDTPPSPVVTNPPRPQPADPAPATPPGAVVTNPPRPQPAQPAPPPKVVMNPPRPTAPAAGTTWHVFKTKDGCEAALDVSCPTGATCNPPPPKAYACEGLSINKPITIVSEGEGICHVQPEPVSCPPKAVCNPPRPRRVACPQ